MSRMCCPNCFGDHGLENDIIPSLSHADGDCDFCGSKGVNLVNPRLLSDVFEMLIGIYNFSDSGVNLVDCLKRDWSLFSHEDMHTSLAKDLLAEILDDGEIVRKNFEVELSDSSKGLATWSTLREELLTINRYFLDGELDTGRLEQLLPHLIADTLPKDWYRARIMADSTIIALSNMGAPPNHLASHGRANPVGIPYLYLASQPQTAISEIRPHTGEHVTVATFNIDKDLKVIDLRNPRKFVSPFILAETGAIQQLLADLPFLEKLGEELTRPVLPRSAAIDYIPSQYLCEFIKKVNFDGVLYNSSMQGGMNLALFYPTKANPVEACECIIGKVVVDYSS
ncbi:RES family NAD+ phosphorylase [Cobetia amphilecti]|nr:RES family NAD+ phosphorylase [Cobetia litoralis]